jgi:hypothetical protein
MWDINNDQKLVYGFLTTGIDWQLVTYDGQTVKSSEFEIWSFQIWSFQRNSNS